MPFIAADGTVCPTKQIKSLHEEATGIKTPEREMPHDAICANNHAFLTEDDENWYFVPYDTDEPIDTYPKSQIGNQEFPFSLVAKWGFTVINEKRYEEMEREKCIRLGLDYDKIKAEQEEDDEVE